MSDDEGKANDPRRHELRADAANALAPSDWLSQAADRKAKHILMTGLVGMAREILSEKHSPGPWTLGTHPRHGGDEIRDARGEMVISAAVEDYGGAGASMSISEPDARLVCAAPEMLALLRRAFCYVDDGGRGDSPADLLSDEIRALLTRIEGAES